MIDARETYGGIYYLLETELRAVKYAELFDVYNPMMHVGP